MDCMSTRNNTSSVVLPSGCIHGFDDQSNGAAAMLVFPMRYSLMMKSSDTERTKTLTYKYRDDIYFGRQRSLAAQHLRQLLQLRAVEH